MLKDKRNLITSMSPCRYIVPMYTDRKKNTNKHKTQIGRSAATQTDSKPAPTVE